MTVTALGVDLKSGYPRAFVEPLLWLAVTTGVVWLAVTIDAKAAVSTGAAPITHGISKLAAGLALVLLLNGIAALLMASQGGSVARGLAAIAGLGVAVSGWAFTLVPELDPELRHWLFLGSVAAGIALVVLSQMHWKEIPGPPGSEVRGAVELVLVLGLGVVAGLLAWAAYGALSGGLVGVGSRHQSAWTDFLPYMQGLTVVLATMGQVWNRRWLAAGITMVVGTVLTGALYLVA